MCMFLLENVNSPPTQVAKTTKFAVKTHRRCPAYERTQQCSFFFVLADLQRSKQRKKKQLVKRQSCMMKINFNTLLQSISPENNFRCPWVVMTTKRQTMHHFSPQRDLEKCLCIPEVGALHADLEWKLKQRRKPKEKGSILTRAGTLEAVFEQGEECSARGRISGGEEKRTSAVQGMKGLEKQCGIKLCEICWVGSGLAQSAL